VSTRPSAVPVPPGAADPQTSPAPKFGSAWRGVRRRILGGLLFVLPVLITFWVVYWLYLVLEKYVIDPLARLVLWQVRQGQPDADLQPWFETYAAPLIGVVVAVALLYCLGFFVNSRLRRAVDWVLLRVPGVSVVYNGMRQVESSNLRFALTTRASSPRTSASLASMSSSRPTVPFSSNWRAAW
jgi:hypothetical protein